MVLWLWLLLLLKLMMLWGMCLFMNSHFHPTATVTCRYNDRGLGGSDWGHPGTTWRAATVATSLPRRRLWLRIILWHIYRALVSVVAQIGKHHWRMLSVCLLVRTRAQVNDRVC